MYRDNIVLPRLDKGWDGGKIISRVRLEWFSQVLELVQRIKLEAKSKFERLFLQFENI